MEIPTKFRSVSAAFRYWLLAFVLLASTTMLISCGGDETTITITGGGGATDTLVINAPSNVERGSEPIIISVLATAAGVGVDGEIINFQIGGDDQSGGSLSPKSAKTVDGVASTTYTPGIFNIPAIDTITISSGTNNVFYTHPGNTCKTDPTGSLNPTDPNCKINISVTTPGLDSVEVTARNVTLQAVDPADYPPTVQINNQTFIDALVTAAGTPLEGVFVDFATTAGTICTEANAATCTAQQVPGVQTNLSGIATIILQSSTNLGTATVQANAEGFIGSVDVTFIPGPAASFTLNASPENITADASSTSQVSTIVRDSEGQIVADGTIVSFSVETVLTQPATAGSFPFPPEDVTDGGIASLTYTSGNTPGDIDIQVSSEGSNSGTLGNALITLNQEAVGDVSVVVEPNSLIANGAADNTVFVRATVTNTSGAPVNAGTDVTISTSEGLLDFVSPIGSDGSAGVPSLVATTDNLGIATVFLQSSTLAGQYLVTATSGGRIGVADVTFEAGITDETNPDTKLTVSPNIIKADGLSTATITLTAEDEFGNPVADGKTVIFSTNNGEISNETVTSKGIATATITSSTTSTVVNGVLLNANIDSKNIGTSMTFDVSNATNPNIINLELSDTTISVESPAGTDSITITATVLDANGNEIGTDCTDNITFTINTTLTGLKLDGIPYTGLVTTTTSGGIASVILTTTGGTTETGTLRLEVEASQNTGDCIGGTPTTVTALSTAITITSGRPNAIQVYGLPVTTSNKNTDGTYSQTINAFVTDASGNPVENGTAVSFALDTAGLLYGFICGAAVTGENELDLQTCAPLETGTTGIKGVAHSLLTYDPAGDTNPYIVTATTDDPAVPSTPLNDTYNGIYSAP